MSYPSGQPAPSIASPTAEPICLVLGQVGGRLDEIEERLIQLRARINSGNQATDKAKIPTANTMQAQALELRNYSVRISDLIAQLEQAL